MCVPSRSALAVLLVADPRTHAAQILAHLSYGSLRSVSLLSKFYRDTTLLDKVDLIWARAREAERLPDLDEGGWDWHEAGYANLVHGKHCEVRLSSPAGTPSTKAGRRADAASAPAALRQALAALARRLPPHAPLQAVPHREVRPLPSLVDLRLCSER